ncbi:hypothetical protein [Methanoregula sp.]|jgi:hypothetical protein|uniref:hypothetical protein n=1 Tax=Methanoregula sp. TaxID=2052170 RepID=UPI003C2913CF
MDPVLTTTPYRSLVQLVDRLLDDCDEDVECLAIRLGGLDEHVRDELLVSDLLNAWQVFFYYFRTDPGVLNRERLDLEPASSLAAGFKLDEIDLLELVFLIRDHEPWMIVSDGEKAVASFKGRTAYGNAMKYCKDPEW